MLLVKRDFDLRTRRNPVSGCASFFNAIPGWPRSASTLGWVT